MSFVHLHTHSEYSLLDGANRIDDLVARAVEFGMPALALTDHGNLHGAWEFQEKAREAGVKPIIGCEAYVAYGDRRRKEKPAGAPAESAHLVLLAENRTGYENLVELSSIGYLEGFYRKPRIDHDALEEHAEGLIALSACLSGEVAEYLSRDRWEDAKRRAEWYASVFGEDRYWLEVQDHGIGAQDKVNRGVFELADELGLGVVATNDAHYLRRDDADAHDTLLCIGTGKDKEDEDRLRFDTEESYFKSPDEMRALFPDRPELMENTLRVADRCGFTFEESYHLPNFPLPERFTDDDAYLRHLAVGGAGERYGEPLPDEVGDRLKYELGVIEETGYAGYFLIVYDFIRAAREMDVPVGPGRGSAAGSIVSYCLGVTDVDPLRFDLIFERFLNPERVSMPDIDIDFCYERRGEVIDYVREKYGEESVGQIITFGRMKARAVVRDVGRVLGFTPAETDRLAKMIPSSPGYSPTVEEAVEQVAELKELYRESERHRRLLDYATRIEGLARHSSVHAAGVVIAPGPLTDYVPVCTDSRNGEDVVTQFEMTALEKAGMLKMDFLGLRTLTVIDEALRLVESRHGVALEWDEIGLEDDAVYGMLASGGTAGVFQFESALATDKLRAMRCDRFDDLIAVNALIRPGPLDSGMTDVYIRRKLGQEAVGYPHPDLEGILEPTYGVITYQEQVMRTANVLAGFSLAEADVLRKAVGKKDAELTDRVLSDFTHRAVERGVGPGTARDIAEMIRTFGRYGFNKAHSAAYAVLSYRTAWLKSHYPAEFMAALLSSEIGDTDKVVAYIGEARELDIEVLPPNVDESGYKFTVVDDDRIRFGLGAIKGVGRSAIESILDARSGEGTFDSLFDFCRRIDLRLNNKRALEAMIQAGALDELGGRAPMVAGLDAVISEAQLRKREEEAGQGSLFGGGGEGPERPTPELPDVAGWGEKERLAREKEVLGFYTSGHPLDRFAETVRFFSADVNTSNLSERRGEQVRVACVVTEADARTSRRDGREYGRLLLEDFHGTATALVFGDTWREHRELLTQDAPVLVTGQVSDRSRDEDDPPIFVDSARKLSDVKSSGRVAVCIELRQADDVRPDVFAEVRRRLEASPGNGPLYLDWTDGDDGGRQRLASRSLRVEPSRELLDDLRALLGRERVRFEQERDDEAGRGTPR